MEAKEKCPKELAIMLIHKVRKNFRDQVTVKRGIDLGHR